MQRLTKSFDVISGQWSPFIIYWTKVKTLHLNCLPFICKMMQASKANESVSECSKTGLCIYKVKGLRMFSRGNTWKSFKCDRGPTFQVTNLNRNLTQFRPSKIHCQPDPTKQNGSLRHVTNRNVVWSFRKATLESGVSSNWPKLKFYHWNYHRKINVLLHLSLSTLLVEKW